MNDLKPVDINEIDGPTLERWRGIFSAAAIRRGVPLHEVQDFTSWCFLAWVEGGYSDIYDPKKSKFTTFLFNFAAFRAQGWRDRLYRRNQKESALVADSLEPEDDDGSSSEWRELIGIDAIAIFESDQIIEDFLEVLERNHPPIETVIHYVEDAEGQVVEYQIERSLATLAKLLLSGFTQREISKLYNRSTGTVSGMIRELRACKEIQEVVFGDF